MATDDAATHTHVLSGLYAAMRSSPAPMDVADLFRQLGVAERNGAIATMTLHVSRGLDAISLSHVSARARTPRAISNKKIARCNQSGALIELLRVTILSNPPFRRSSMFSQKAQLTLASAAALFAFTNGTLMATAYAADQGTEVAAPCYGVNSCKGQSDCKSGNHACKGQNSCKGQGFKDISAQQCQAQHGSTSPK